MPFKSKAQVGKFASLVGQGKMSKDTFHAWAAETPNIKKLPNLMKKPAKFKP